MAKFGKFTHTAGRAGAGTGKRRALLWGAALAAALGVAGCAVEIQNQQAAKEVERAAKPPGSVYLGWRVFQDKCVSCHGPGATGTARGPDLLPRLREMGPHQFVGLVLKRYDWGLPAGQSAGGPASQAQLDAIVLRKDAPRPMPAWQGEPSVNAHIADLYAYLSARAQGAQGPGRPAQ